MGKINHNLEDCIDCKSCMKGCLMIDEFTDSPKSFLKDFTLNKPSANVSFSCATCDYCYTVCPVDISFQNIFSESKKTYAKDDKVLKSFGYKGIMFHQKNSFSKLFTAKTRFNTGEFKNIAFMPGCALSSYSPKIVQQTYKHLQSIFPGINILQQCCGQPTKIVGDTKRFQTYHKILRDDISYMEADTVITACENCYISIKQHSPDIKVITLYEILAQYGIPKNKENVYKDLEPVALHDPCPTRSHDALHKDVRSILTQMGVEFKEFKNNRTKTECCGSGGMLECTNPKLAFLQMKTRAEQTDCETIVSYCQSCAESMTKGGKNGIHILDLLFHENKTQVLKQKKVKTIFKWYNRYKSKKMIEKIKV